MIPLVTPEEMRGVDARASEAQEILVGRAGHAVAVKALELLSGGYGKRVVVVAGPGNNGADGRVAAADLRRRGARVVVVDPLDPGLAHTSMDSFDLIIDAAFGTGANRGWAAPPTGRVKVLAVDIPSGIDGLTGEELGAAGPSAVIRADHTVSFAALKPGLLLGQGKQAAGVVTVVEIGLEEDCRQVATTWLVEDSDVLDRLPRRNPEGHKYEAAVAVVAGSPGMTGAAHLVTRAAMAAGAGYVRLMVPGLDPALGEFPPGEAVVVTTTADDWAEQVAGDLSRFKSLVIGPGLGRGRENAGQIERLAASVELPMLIDGDAIRAIGGLEGLRRSTQVGPRVVTPHDGEWAALTGSPPAADRISEVRKVAGETGATVLLKGPTTVVGAPDGTVLVSDAGDSRLATAGSGDALSGIIGALMAGGLSPLWAAAAGTHIHGRAAEIGPRRGLVAGELPALVGRWLSLVTPPVAKPGVRPR